VTCSAPASPSTIGLPRREKPLPTLSAAARSRLPDSAFAYVDSKGIRRLPIHDASHVRNALARFDQVAFEDDAARERARQRLLRAAKKHGIVPIGFFDVQLRKERFEGEVRARATDVRSLPRGRVTFLFSDIEGSTRLLRELGDRYASVLRDVRRIIRKNVRDAEGTEVDSRADESFAVFRDAGRALDAAVRIQRAMRDQRWPRRADVRVRIGIHTGRPTLSDTGYVGIAVHAAARICAAGHGEQVLVSETARQALGRGGRDEITLTSLGRHSLPSLAEPTTLYQVRADGLRSDFPRLRTEPATTATRARRRSS
jgi:class 3 adenylate cyclase